MFLTSFNFDHFDHFDHIDHFEVVEMVELVKIDCEKSMKLETSPKVTKSKRNLHWCRSISNTKTCSFCITVSVKKLLHYRAGGLLQYRAFYYIIGQLLHYRAFFITLSGTYYSIGRLLHYRLPILFLIYINDLEEGVTSKILKFADDTKLFRKIKGIGDKQQLQDDIDKLIK